MSDLISRSNLVSELSDYTLQVSPTGYENPEQKRTAKNVYDAIQLCIECVEEQPTAYSVDDVVEELQRESYAIMLDGALVASKEVVIDAKRAIEIVKQGGVRKDEE